MKRRGVVRSGVERKGKLKAEDQINMKRGVRVDEM